jgi:hypothetical protein
MALSATPTPWYRPPPFVNNIRWWNDFFLNFPHPLVSDKLNDFPDELAPLKTHGQAHSTLGSIPKIFFGLAHVLGISSTSSSEALKLPASLHLHSTNFNYYCLANEDPKQTAYKQDKNCGERGVPPHAKEERSCHWAGGGAHCEKPYDRTQGHSNSRKQTRRGRGRSPQILPSKREVLANIQGRGFSGSNKYPVQQERGPHIDLDRRGPRIDLDRCNLHGEYPISFDDMDPRKQTSFSSTPKQLSVGNRSPFLGVLAGMTNDSGKYPSSFNDMDLRKQTSVSSAPKQLSVGNGSPFPGVVAGTTYDSVQVAKRTTPAPLCTRSRSCSRSAPRGHIRPTAPQGTRALTPAKALTKPPALILEILHSQMKLRITTSPLPNALPPPPSFANVAARPPSLKPLELTPTNLAITSATLELTTAVKKQ